MVCEWLSACGAISITLSFSIPSLVAISLYVTPLQSSFAKSQTPTDTGEITIRVHCTHNRYSQPRPPPLSPRGRDLGTVHGLYNFAHS